MPALLDTPDLRTLADAIDDSCVMLSAQQGGLPTPGASQTLARQLAETLARLLPGVRFREALTRGGWYRLGSVIDGNGERVAAQLGRWAEDALASHGGDLHALADDCAARGLRATCLNGKTHYWVAQIGPAATDMLQLEIEELQEVVSHVLVDDDAPSQPTSLEELIDPGEDTARLNLPIGAPFYSLRRLAHVGDFLATLRAQKPQPQAVHRFIDDWQRSSAGASTLFSTHWLLALREYVDRYHQTIYQARPLAAAGKGAPTFASCVGMRGRALQEALTAFDRQAGYPMAWFFHTLTSKAVPLAVTVAVVEDMHAGFHYLPQRDLDVVTDSLHRPYSF
ncbi:hypothetical protein GH865_03850 [Rhodocyclus tenuis]|uniref:hypothetical protein n=1 Tax=Rhodocyclus gracilis TaxID=2929842 RepID=UPI001298E24B|nr:hypothetical protein [Rhodocyclus gracilis]MRD72386.1 hypothetical protein [Rhodocyclus gracilis]